MTYIYLYIPYIQQGRNHGILFIYAYGGLISPSPPNQIGFKFIFENLLEISQLSHVATTLLLR